jgi:hypothetical protein
VVQQAQRADANYPQIQLAEDTAAQLKSSFNPSIPASLAPADMRSSLAPFIIIYDKKGKVVSGSGYLNGKVAKAPLSMLEASKGKDYNAETWQPQKGVRIAAVTVTSDKYYVLSGRSLKEVEKNENRTFWLAFAGFILSLLLIAAGVVAKVAVSRPAISGTKS